MGATYKTESNTWADKQPLVYAWVREGQIAKVRGES